MTPPIYVDDMKKNYRALDFYNIYVVERSNDYNIYIVIKRNNNNVYVVITRFVVMFNLIDSQSIRKRAFRHV